MMERFYLLRRCIRKSITDLKLVISFSDSKYEILSSAISSLVPVKVAVEAICRNYAYLIAADTTFKFLINELQKIDSPISIELLDAVKKRIFERRTVCMMHLKK